MKLEKAPEGERKVGISIKGLEARLKGAPMLEALSRADRSFTVLPSILELRETIDRNNTFFLNLAPALGVYRCWSGILVAYERPNRALDSNVAYTDENTGIRYVFPVPRNFIGEMNLLLVAEHPNFHLQKEEKDTYVVHAENVAATGMRLHGQRRMFPCECKFGRPSVKLKPAYYNRAQLIRAERMVGLMTVSLPSRGSEGTRISLATPPSNPCITLALDRETNEMQLLAPYIGGIAPEDVEKDFKLFMRFQMK